MTLERSLLSRGLPKQSGFATMRGSLIRSSERHLLSASGGHDLRGLAAAGSQRILLRAQSSAVTARTSCGSKSHATRLKNISNARIGSESSWDRSWCNCHLIGRRIRSGSRHSWKPLQRTTSWAVEFRDRRWLSEEVFEILNGHGTTLCIHDMIDDHPQLVTAGWVYLRFHGDHCAR